MKVVFITHRADRTGAPLFLLEIIGQFKVQFPFTDITIVTLYNGILVKRYKEFGRVIVMDRFENKFLEKVRLNRITKAIKIKYLSQTTFDFAYVNSSCSWSFYQNYIVAKNAYFHLHELKNNFKFCFTDYNIASLDFSRINRLLCVSQVVKDFFDEEIGNLDPSKISIVPGFYKENVPTVRNRANDKITIGSMGIRSDMKGFGIFKEVASKFINNDAVRFIWIGGAHNEHCSNVPSNLSLIPHTSSVDQYYNSLDVFCLLSLEDSFPLAVLEISRYKIPVICYNKNNGVSEIIKQNRAGIVTEYLSLEDVVAAIQKLVSNPQLRIEMGSSCKKAFSGYTLKNTMDTLTALLKVDGII